MEKRKGGAPIRSISSRSGIVEFDIDNVDSIVDRKKHTWKRFSFMGVILIIAILMIIYYGKPKSNHHLKHSFSESEYSSIVSGAGSGQKSFILPPVLDATRVAPDLTSPAFPKEASPPVSMQLNVKPAAIVNKVADLEANSLALIDKLRVMKQHGTIMETNTEAKLLIGKLQADLRELIVMKYGPEPYYVEMTLTFPTSMKDIVEKEMVRKIVIELAPLSAVPYCVYNFLNIVETWKGGKFHRNAGHVLQAMVKGNGKGLAFQEYSPDFPHKKFTLGYAGRPGGPAFYISTIDNTANHGPGSQGSKTEADGIFGRVVPGSTGEEVVRKMQKQPGKGQSGFIDDSKNFIDITTLKLIKNPQ